MLIRLLTLLLAILFPLSDAWAHFGLLIPSGSTVTEKRDSRISFQIAFSHPFSQKGMVMAKPREFLVKTGNERIDLTGSLQPETYLDQPAFRAEYTLPKPGVYQFGVVPEPYFEPAEDCFIIHYPKTVIGAYGYEDGWDVPLGLPVEIVPLSRPFANYSGNVFTGMALKAGKPLANAEVEVEFLNSENRYKAPDSYYETQMVRTDANGIFNFGIPWPGWWGFAVLTEGDKMARNGEEKDVELGGIIWLEFRAPEVSK